ncbi:MAG: rhodanese-like domain-containing protein [Pseudomonadota bacterium]
MQTVPRKPNPEISILRLAFFVSATVMISMAFAGSDGLDRVRQSVKEKYDVEHITNSQLDSLSGNNVIVFDVREKEEHSVSHLESAIRLSPQTTAKQFLETYGDQVDGKTVVFYCSVGERSSIMLSKLNQSLADAGAVGAFNLDGGIFARHNENRPLMKGEHITRDIHPFNAYWGRLINNQSSIRYD